MSAKTFKPKASPSEVPYINVKLTEHNKNILKRHLRKAFFFRTILGVMGAYLAYHLVHAAISVFVFHKSTLVNYYIFIHVSVFLLLAMAFISLNIKTMRLFEDLRKGVKQVIVERITSLLKSLQPMDGPNFVASEYPCYNDVHFFYIQIEKYWIQTDYNTFESAETGKILQIHCGLKSGIILETEL